ncbi:MAG: PhnA domain-containing protein [Mariprofundaceae bacterium]|nr:PhnA domain-containing protein [Mariprofundaceae bacterium]
MTIQELQVRSEGKCELCANTEGLEAYDVPASPSNGVDASVFLCPSCRGQLEDPESIDVNHWRCLNDSMWSQIPAVQVMAWRMLTRLSSEGWTQDLLDVLYLEEDVLAWAQAGDEGNDPVDTVIHRDSNGVTLEAGDTVTLIKDLGVKGANFTAKRGTAVRGISLVADNAEHIEGRVSGQRIVILTKFVKKSS